MDPSTARRLGFALAISAALHVALLSSLQLGELGSIATSGVPVEAWLERMSGDPAPEPAPDFPALPEAPSEPSEPPTEVAATPAEASVAPPRREAQDPKVEDKLGTARTEREPSQVMVPVPHDLTYYPVVALDSPPRPLGAADACYPEGAQGEVAYVLLIDEAGNVNEASLASVRPEGISTAAALAGCRALKFAPAMKDGRAVRSRVRFVVGPSAT